MATDFVIEPIDLALVLDAISGLRADAYHPSGRYGFLQLTAAELGRIGLADPEQVYGLTALRQLDVVRARLVQLEVGAPASAAHLWAALLVPGFDMANAEPNAVVATPRRHRSRVVRAPGRLRSARPGHGRSERARRPPSSIEQPGIGGTSWCAV